MSSIGAISELVRIKVIEVKEYAEEPVVSKQARVKGEVRVKKDASERTAIVRDTVCRTEVDVENLNTGKTRGYTSALEDEFRTDFASRYPHSDRYDTYAPAYCYGYEMAKDRHYYGRDFAEVEPEVRIEYRRYPNTTWDKIKDSVRYGWSKATGRARSAPGSR